LYWLYLKETIALYYFDWRIWPNKVLNLQVKFLSAKLAVLLLCVLVVPDNSAVALLNTRSVNVVAILLHDLLQYFKPTLG